MPRVLVVQNGPNGGPGRFGDWLVEAGLTLDVVHAYAADPLPDRVEQQAMMVMGGGYLPDDDARAPWLAPVRELVHTVVARSVPYLGICLGGQLLAHVAGGTVRARHGEPEIGSTTLTLRPEAAGDPLFRDLPGTVTAIERHVDTITALPPGARWLAASDRCPYQAFRYGDRAWGVQFHPEVTAARIKSWDPAWVRGHGFDLDRLHRRAEADAPAAARTWREVARRFAAIVRAN